MVLWWLGLGGAYCRYRDTLDDVVRKDLPQSTRALLKRGFETCAAAAASGGGGGERSLRRRAAAALARVRWRAQGLCPRGGDHREAEHKAFKLALKKGTSLTTISCFPENLWDHRVMSEYSTGGWTPLHVALAAGNLVVAERLLRRGDADTFAADGIQPICCAVENCAALDEDTQLQALRLHLQFGFSLNCADGEGNPLVCRAASVCSVKVLEFFFQHGVDIDTCDNSGRNLLHYASKANVDFLLACGVNPNAVDGDGRFPVHSAAIGGRVEALEALLPHTQENPHDFDGNTPLHLAAQDGHATVVKLLAHRDIAVNDSVDCTVRALSLESENGLSREEHTSKGSSHRQMAMQQKTYDVNAKNSNGCTALHLAMGNGHMTVSKTLLSCGADPNVLDNHLQTAFDYVFRGDLDLYEAADLLELLLEAGANPCYQDESGRNALCKALLRGNIKLFRLLLQCGVQVDLKGVGGCTALHLAAGSGKDDFVKLLLAHGADPSTLDDNGETPLNAASGRKEMFYAVTARVLLEAGADPNHRDAAGSFPLHRATEVGHLPATTMLLECGARVDLKDAQGRTPLHLAACNGKYNVVKLLLTHEADPSALDNKGETPLNVAREIMREVHFTKVTKVTEMLLEAGADPNHRDAAGSFPLHLAVEDWDLSATTMLLEAGADPNHRDAWGSFPLLRAVETGDVEAAVLLLKHGSRVDLEDAEGRTALHLAAVLPDAEVAFLHAIPHSRSKIPVGTNRWRVCFFATKMIKVLLEAGADSNHRDAVGRFPLLHAVEEWNLRTVKLLLEHGARVDLKDAQGRTALHLAAGRGYDNFVKLLLAHGADSSELDDKGETPLIAACRRMRGLLFKTEVPKVLLEAGADPNLRDAAGSFPLHRVVEDGDVEATVLLLEHGSRVDLEDAQGRTALHLAAVLPHEAEVKYEVPLIPVRRNKWKVCSFATKMMKVLLEAGADPNHRDTEGCLPLLRAVETGDVEAAELLLEHGARAYLEDAQGRTALHMAAVRGRKYFVKQLLAHGADPSALDDKGETPLNVASREFGFTAKVTKMLLEAGADPNHRDAEGSFPLLRAVENGDVEAAELLLENGARADLKNAQGRTALHLAKEYAGPKGIRKKMLVLLKKSLESS